MGIFDFFKKKQNNNSFSENKNIYNLEIGDTLDYFMKSWKVEEVLDYDYGNNIFSTEYTLNAGDEVVYLEVEEKSSDVSISSSIKMKDLGKGLRQEIIENDIPPKKIIYKDEEYFYSEESLGQCSERGSDDYSEFVNWIFMNSSEDKFISIDRWDETDLEASEGYYGKSIEFSNIIGK